MANLHNSRSTFEVNGKTYNYFRLAAIEEAGIAKVSRLPYSIKVLLESVLRQYDNYVIKDEHVNELANFGNHNADAEVPFKPSRVVLQDFTGVPVVVDLASLRSAMKEMGGDPAKINPAIPV
ncbi:MAG: aconitase family protein, partial [Solibacillus sp.]